MLSPFLVKEPYSIAVINFIFYGLATLSYFRLARFLSLGVSLSILLALVIWIYPINFGFMFTESVPVLGLDALFFGIKSVAVINLLIFVLDPRKTFNAVIAGTAIGLSIWARGNNAPGNAARTYCRYSRR